MKILYVNNAWAIWGGLERVLIEKMNYLADKEGYEVFSITHSQGTHPFPYPFSPKVVHRDLKVVLHHQYRFHGLKRYYYKYHLEKLLIQKIKSSVQEIMPDMIVCPRIELLGYILKAKGRIPLIYECHNACKWIAYENDNLLWRVKRYCLKRQAKKVQMVVALTEGDALEWRGITSHVCVIPNIVHLNHTGYYSDCQSKSVIYVGRISRQKDIMSLLQIWSLVHQSFPDWQLHIYGACEYGAELFQSTIERMNANITLHQPTRQIIDKYLESSMLLLTSCYEPFGLVLPEAMSCGLPVVSFDCPYGPADIITHGVDGFLIRNRNVKEFADKVCRLMENQELRIKMGKAGIISSQRYEASKIMPQWKKLFENNEKYG